MLRFNRSVQNDFPRKRRARPAFERLEDRCNPVFSLGPRLTSATASSDFVDPQPTILNQVASATSNNVSVVVWVETGPVTGGTQIVKGQLVNPDGSNRGAAITVFDSPATESNPSVAMDANGNWIVVLERKEPFVAQRNLWFVRFNAQGVRQGSYVPAAATAVNEHEPSVAMDPSGNFVITYTRDTGPGNSDVQFRRYAANGAFLNAGAVSALASANERGSQVARNANSEFVVTFLRNDAALLRKFNPFGAAQWIRTANPSGTIGSPKVSMDNSGNSVVSFVKNVGVDATLHYRRFFPSGAFQAITPVPTPDVRVDAFSRIALPPSGPLSAGAVAASGRDITDDSVSAAIGVVFSGVGAEPTSGVTGTVMDIGASADAKFFLATFQRLETPVGVDTTVFVYLGTI